MGCAIPPTATCTLIRPNWTIPFISVSTPPDNDMALPFLTHGLLRHDVIPRTRHVGRNSPGSGRSLPSGRPDDKLRVLRYGLADVADYAALIRPTGACGSRQTVRVCRTPTHGRSACISRSTFAKWPW